MTVNNFVIGQAELVFDGLNFERSHRACTSNEN